VHPNGTIVNLAVIGAGLAGLAGALVLARRGHQVVLLETDGAPVPAGAGEMWAAWHRPGVSQARHFHAFPGRVCKILREHAPDVLADVLAHGAGELIDPAPDGSVEAGDEDFVLLLCRRPVFEGVLRRAVQAEPNVRMMAGRAATGLVVWASANPSVPFVRGVRLTDGREILADAVVDASGRRSKVPAWLAAEGARSPQEESSPTGVVYYGRHFAVRSGTGGTAVDGPRPARISLGYLNGALWPLDNYTFIVNFAVPASDRDLRALHHERAFMAAARSVPGFAPWVDPACAEPVGRVESMGQLRNTWRRFVVDGGPIALGLHVVGDALCHTNPSHAKGTSLAFAHAAALADVLDMAPHDPLQRALLLDRAMSGETRQTYDFSVTADRAAVGTWHGEPTATETPQAFIRTVIAPAAKVDPVVFRAYQRHFHVLSPANELLGDADVVERARRVASAQQSSGAVPQAPAGPSRSALLALLASEGDSMVGAARTDP
jgi:2-polyprenyl-6-methoxyphenol hydroxylase-like FAD-dependent oxidoreductase